MIYFLCYAVSLLLLWLAYRAKRKIVKRILFVLSVAIPVFLAGARDYTVGIDTKNYLRYYNFLSRANDIETLFFYATHYNNGSGEWLFTLLNWLSIKSPWGFRTFLFVSHGVIMSCIFIGAHRLRKYVNPILVVFLFYFLYYDYSLNILRQYIAMSVLFAVLADILEGNYKRYLIVTFIAFTIHSSAIIGILPLLIYIYIKRKSKVTEKFSKFRMGLVITATIAVVVLLEPLMKLATLLGFGNYNFYFQSDMATPALFSLYFLILEMIGVILYSKPYKKRFKYADFFLTITIVFIAIQQVSWFLAFGRRISMYFSYANMITLASLSKSQKEKNNRLVCTGVIVLAVLLYWGYGILLKNPNGTLPYSMGL